MENVRSQTHQTMYNVLTYLADKWHIGVISAIYAYVLSNINVMFSEDAIRIAGGISIYLGAGVAFLTVFMKTLDLYDKLKKRWRR